MIDSPGLVGMRDSVVVVAFEGWNDAADAATATVEFLESAWSARPVGAIDPDDYYDFQVNRPTVEVGAEGRRTLTWPTTRFSRTTIPGTGRDALLVRGIEPNMRWRSFTEEILQVARRANAGLVLVLGALLADSPHTRPVPVNGTTSDPGLAARLVLEESRYEGPTGIVGVLTDLAAHSGLPAVSLWAAVPHYAAQPPCPKAALALLQRVEDLLDTSMDLHEMTEAARAWERGVDELAAEDPEVAEYVASLERAKDTTELPEASGDAIAREFERYLRRRDTDDRGSSS
ncbi:MAG: PAC2 family protein [Actinomycetes bacterium]